MDKNQMIDIALIALVAIFIILRSIDFLICLRLPEDKSHTRNKRQVTLLVLGLVYSLLSERFGGMSKYDILFLMTVLLFSFAKAEFDKFYKPLVIVAALLTVYAMRPFFGF